MPTILRALRLSTILAAIALGISVLLIGLVSVTEMAGKHSGGGQSLCDRSIERRVVETVIWGMLRKTNAKVGQVVYLAARSIPRIRL